MRKALCILVLLGSVRCAATDKNDQELWRLVNMSPEVATQGYVAKVMGSPVRIDEGKKRTTWIYSDGVKNVEISWNNKSSAFEKFSFHAQYQPIATFDNNLPLQLKSGSTDLQQALRLLGTPNEMTVRNKTQEIHYAYQQKVLRLFFRDRILVDYCLY